MPTQRPTFFSLPSELRHQIYSTCFDKGLPHNPQYYQAVASVCRRIRSEALPILLQQARYFQSLEAFIGWTTKGNADLLRHISNVSLHCTQSSLHPLLTTKASDNSSPTTQLEPDDVSPVVPHGSRPPQRAIFPSIPNLQHLSLNLSLISRIHGNDDSHNYHGQHEDQETLLRLIATACPKLESLSLITDLIHLTCLQDFQNLRSLKWSGYSLSTPQETLSTLNALPSLHTVRLERFPEIYDHEHHSVPTAELRKYFSFTTDVLRDLKLLKCINISHLTSRVPSDVLTAGMLIALESHTETLTELGLGSDHFVEGAVLDQILNVVSSFCLKRVSVRLWSVPGEYKSLKLRDYIAPSVQYCDIVLRVLGGRQDVILEHKF